MWPLRLLVVLREKPQQLGALLAGVCRQVIREWCDPATFRIVLGKADAAPREYLLQDILPMGFGPEDLGESSPAGASGDDAVKGADGGHEHGCGCGCSENGKSNQ